MTSEKSGYSRVKLPRIFVLVVVKTITAILPGGGTDSTHGTYFQYINVPGKNEYNFGFNRGNSDHYISRYEQGKDWNFRTKVHWADKHGGSGEHYWEYNHIDKGSSGKDGHDGHDHGGDYGGLTGEYGNLQESYQSQSINHPSPPILTEPVSSTGYGDAAIGYSDLGAIHDHLANRYSGKDDSQDIYAGTYGTLDQFSNLPNSFVKDALAYKIIAEELKSSFAKPKIHYEGIDDTRPEASLYTNKTQTVAEQTGNLTKLSEQESEHSSEVSDNQSKVSVHSADVSEQSTGVPLSSDNVPQSSNSKQSEISYVNTTLHNDENYNEEGDEDDYNDEEFIHDDFYDESDEDMYNDDDSGLLSQIAKRRMDMQG